MFYLNKLEFCTVSLAGADSVEASDAVELDNESTSLKGSGNVSLIHLRYSITSSVTRIILPSILHKIYF